MQRPFAKALNCLMTLPTKTQTNKQTMRWTQNRQAYIFLFATLKNTRFPQLLQLLCIFLFWYTLF